MDISLSTLLQAASSPADQSKVYHERVRDRTRAIQALMQIITMHYQEHEETFRQVYHLWSRKLTPYELTRLYEVGQQHGITLHTILHDIQAPQFRNLMTQHWADLNTLVQQENFTPLSYFTSALDSITHADLATQTWLESYLQTSLLYHQKDLNKASHTILQLAQAQSYTKPKLLAMQPPKHKLVIEDWAVTLENKDEIALYQQRTHYILYQAIKSVPYFLFVWDATDTTFIGTHKYKQAIISYTSEQARALRFESSESTTADLLITDGKYKKIYIRGSDEDHKRRYDTDKQYDSLPHDYTVNSFFESESGLSEISHLMTSHQDLIFRSPTTGTALVEWVSWSGKTNLIFHRIDYLLQERPDQFQAQHIWVFTPNDILAAYMQAALDATSFTFREHVSIHSFESLHALPHPTQSTYVQSDRDTVQAQVVLIQDALQSHFDTSCMDILSDTIGSIQDTMTTLQHDYQQQSSLQQHVHKVWYTKDISLLEQILDTLTKLRDTIPPSIPVYLEQILHAVTTTLYKTYVWDDHTADIKQYYHDELFDTAIQQIQQTITTYQDVLAASRIGPDLLLLTGYTPAFQALTSRLTTDENILLSRLIHVSILQYIGYPDRYRSYQYVLVDEFQDFHPLALKLIHLLYGTSLILSWDFMQSAWYHDISGLTRLWVQLVDHRTMRDNFRNTLETLQYAHSVFWEQASELFLARRVIKRWPAPMKIDDSSVAGLSAHILSLIADIPAKATIAIVYYDLATASQLYQSLQSSVPILFPSLDAEHHQELITWYYSHQVYIISYRESKWLEFDHVILIDPEILLTSALHYNKKLWYIGCTRAVKTLRVV